MRVTKINRKVQIPPTELSVKLQHLSQRTIFFKRFAQMFIKHLPLNDPYTMNRIGRPRLSTVGRGLRAVAPRENRFLMQPYIMRLITDRIHTLISGSSLDSEKMRENIKRDHQSEEDVNLV